MNYFHALKRLFLPLLLSTFLAACNPSNNPGDDNDGDEFTNAEEEDAGTDPNDAEDYPEDPNGDNDGDGSNNADERDYGSDPDNADSYPRDAGDDDDGDGWTNGEEEDAGSDPNDPEDNPGCAPNCEADNSGH